MVAIKTFVVIGTTPEDAKAKPLEVFLEKGEADAFILRGLWNSLGLALQNVEPGGLVSLQVSIGREGETNSSGSFAVNNPSGRAVWDFAIVPHTSKPEEPA